MGICLYVQIVTYFYLVSHSAKYLLFLYLRVIALTMQLSKLLFENVSRNLVSLKTQHGYIICRFCREHNLLIVFTGLCLLPLLCMAIQLMLPTSLSFKIWNVSSNLLTSHFRCGHFYGSQMCFTKENKKNKKILVWKQFFPHLHPTVLQNIFRTGQESHTFLCDSCAF